VIEPSGVAGSHASESLIPAGERLALTTSAAGLTGSLVRQHSLVGQELAPPDGLRAASGPTIDPLAWYVGAVA
jgi:hypothetical protein